MSVILSQRAALFPVWLFRQFKCSRCLPITLTSAPARVSWLKKLVSRGMDMWRAPLCCGFADINLLCPSLSAFITSAAVNKSIIHRGLRSVILKPELQTSKPLPHCTFFWVFPGGGGESTICAHYPAPDSLNPDASWQENRPSESHFPKILCGGESHFCMGITFFIKYFVYYICKRKIALCQILCW